jgi:hypothetical protein
MASPAGDVELVGFKDDEFVAIVTPTSGWGHPVMHAEEDIAAPIVR